MRKFAPEFVITYLMKRFLRTFCVLLLGAMTLVSCLSSSDDDVTTYNDMAIKSFKLGTLNRYLHTTSSTGTDSVYKASYSAAAYKMNIDQLNHTIYNTDSLLTGTDAAHVICTVTTVNNGVIYIKSLKTDSLYYFSSGSDSIDFSEPRLFRVFATDGSGYRDYMVTLHVRKQDAGVFNWQEAEPTGFPVADDDDVREAAEKAGLTYIGHSSYESYAMNDKGLIMESTDKGATWKEDVLDTDAALLPKTAISYTTWTLDFKTDYALMIGQNPSSDKAMVVWRKLVDDDGNGRWVYMPLADENPFFLPKTGHVQLVRYADSVLAFSSDHNIYQSRDQGITWKKTSVFQYPDGIDNAAECKVAVDNDGYLWLANPVSGQTWKGKLTE